MYNYIDFQNDKTGFVYALYNKKTDDIVYIGSTTLKLSQRFTSHRSTAKHSNNQLYSTLNQLGFENIEIKPLRKLENLKSRIPLLLEEQKFIDILKPVANSNRAVSKEYLKKRLRTTRKFFLDNIDDPRAIKLLSDLEEKIKSLQN